MVLCSSFDLSLFQITAHTAANAHESSYACTYDDDLGTYLGDCWSLNWMNDTDAVSGKNNNNNSLLILIRASRYVVLRKATGICAGDIYTTNYNDLAVLDRFI